jgi:hypothetical protein
MNSLVLEQKKAAVQIKECAKRNDMVSAKVNYSSNRVSDCSLMVP